MVDTEYFALMEKETLKLAELCKRRDQLDVQINKTIEFIKAIVNMLPDKVRQDFLDGLANLEKRFMTQIASLTEAIRKVLPLDKYITAAEVRDRLVDSGFDFSGYTSNPLASVSTTLKRLADEIDMKANSDGVATYKRRVRVPLARRGRRFQSGSHQKALIDWSEMIKGIEQGRSALTEQVKKAMAEVEKQQQEKK